MCGNGLLRRGDVQAPAGNAQLTAVAGMVLLVLFAAELVTGMLGVRNVLTTHVVIGYLLAPPVLVKLGSTGWRMSKYYLADPACRRRGAPRLLLRILGPVIVLLTVTLSGAASSLTTARTPCTRRLESYWLGQFAAESPARLQLSLVEVAQMDPRAWPDVRAPGSVEEVRASDGAGGRRLRRSSWSSV